MKNLKFVLYSVLMALFLVTSCTNNEPVVQEQQETEESQSISTALNRLSMQFDQNGNFTADNNPAGNVVFDFCFDFVYPLTLSYNNGTTVTVDGLEGLVTVILNSTDELYVNGIAFPFDVETYNEGTDAIEVVTITNEDDFVNLIENCDFDDFETCECFEVYDPVCVEITDPTGEVFTVTYPNACYAECDGFTEDDFVDTCEEDYYCPELPCFTLNFPLSIILDDETTVTVNSEEEFGTVLYDVYYFDFVYPFTVTLDNEEVVTINSAEDIEAILVDCYGEYEENGCEECEDSVIDPVCIEYTTATGETIITVFPNMCYAECEGFTLNNVVDCEDQSTDNCNEEDVASALVECEWYAISSLIPNGVVSEFVFNSDGSLVVNSENNAIAGEWELISNPSGALFMSITLPEPYGDISGLDWVVTQCSDSYIVLDSGNNEFLAFEQECN